jgi:hypothetical protein
LPPTGPGQLISNGYNNISWSNAYALQYNNWATTSGYYTAAVSLPIVMYGCGGSSTTMKSTNNSLINLYSLFVAASWYDNLQLTMVGYNSNVVIVNNTYILQVFTVSNLTFTGYTGLDTIIFTTSGGTQHAGLPGSGLFFGMDNICLSFT